jgi:hypothetical protein
VSARQAAFAMAAMAAMATMLVACSTPVPELHLQLTAGVDQMCPSTRCEDIVLPCNAVMSLKIADPDALDTPHISQCLPIPFDTHHTMCSLGKIRLDATALPVRDLEIQVAVFPETMVSVDATRPDGLACPDVDFAMANNFPRAVVGSPALGGRAWYHPGDPSVTVELGCTDLSIIERSCAKPVPTRAVATVDDFDTLLTVPVGGAANLLRVSVGEPQLIDNEYMLTNDSSRSLRLGAEADPKPGTAATWAADLDSDLVLDKFACVEVFEAVAQTTGALRCIDQVDAERLGDLHGVRIAKDTLQKVLAALGGPGGVTPIDFPPQGLTIGIVADLASTPIEGMIVSSSGSEGAVKYLSKDGTQLVDGATSKAGVFVSTDARFGTVFSTRGGTSGRPEISGIGGRVAGRVTIVVLQYGGLSL